MSVSDCVRTSGSHIVAFATYTGAVTLFGLRAVASGVRRPFYIREIIRQMFSIGVKSLPLTGIVAFSVGLVFAMQTVEVLRDFGIVEYLSTLVGLAVVKELGPVLTALMVAARAGSGVSAELGSMRVTRQIDAMRVMAIDPMQYLVATRVLAFTLVVPMLAVLADLLGVFGGWLIGVTQAGISPGYYISTTLQYVTLADVVPGLIKTVFFGFIVGCQVCHQGYHAEGGTEGVGRATTTAVFIASLSVMLADVVLTMVMLWLFK